MGKLDELKQQAEGKIDEIRGEANIRSGDKVKGGMQKLKGKMKQKTASLHDSDDSIDEEV